ncbi:hypothetical protein R1flu_005136 [Riccia fluitans]|uniref:DUF4283 domain-containing protein n=1 Tax=Riccia fluitans TaxID=41844 RepID=A0ABD1YVA8_9MARC
MISLVRGEVLIDAFRGWSGVNWQKSQGLKILNIRKLHGSAFVTTFGSSHDRDTAIALEAATIRGSAVAHVLWSPECENKSYKPRKIPTWVQIDDIPSWLKTKVADIFSVVGLVLRLPLSTKGLMSLKVGGLILWDPDIPPIKEVTVDLNWRIGKKTLGL